jgi:hypothetical protein
MVARYLDIAGRAFLSPTEGVLKPWNADSRYILNLRRSSLGHGPFHRHALGIPAKFSSQKVRLVYLRPEWLGGSDPCAQVPDVSDCFWGYTKLFGKSVGEAVTLCAVVLGGIEDEDSIVRRDYTHTSAPPCCHRRGSSCGGQGVAAHLIILSKRPVVLLLNKLRPETRFHVLIHVYVYVVEVHKCTG